MINTKFLPFATILLLFCSVVGCSSNKDISSNYEKARKISWMREEFVYAENACSAGRDVSMVWFDGIMHAYICQISFGEEYVVSIMTNPECDYSITAYIDTTIHRFDSVDGKVIIYNSKEKVTSIGETRFLWKNENIVRIYYPNGNIEYLEYDSMPNPLHGTFLSSHEPLIKGDYHLMSKNNLKSTTTFDRKSNRIKSSTFVNTYKKGLLVKSIEYPTNYVEEGYPIRIIREYGYKDVLIFKTQQE